MTDLEQKRIISKNLKRLIESSGKEQKQVAADLDINAPTFNQWVNGKAIPSVSMLHTLAEYFAVRIENIVDEQPIRIDYLFSEEAKEIAMAFERADSDTKAMVNRLLKYATFFNERKEK